MQPLPKAHSSEDIQSGCLWCKRHHKTKGNISDHTTEKAKRKSKEILEKAEFIPPSPKGTFSAAGDFRPSPIAPPILAPHIDPAWQPMPARPPTPRHEFEFKDEKGGQKNLNLDKLPQEKPTQLEGD